MAKERIYLTDITLHVREHRQTGNFSKVAEKGRMYSPLPSGRRTNVPEKTAGTSSFTFELPPDLNKRIEQGEVEIMIPEGGIPIYAGKDTREFLNKMDHKARNQLIHRGRSWHADEKDVK